MANLVAGMEQEDPRLIKHIREQRLVAPAPEEQKYLAQKIASQSNQRGPGMALGQKLFQGVGAVTEFPTKYIGCTVRLLTAI